MEVFDDMKKMDDRILPKGDQVWDAFTRTIITGDGVTPFQVLHNLDVAKMRRRAIADALLEGNYIAGVPLSGHKIVMVGNGKAVYFDPSDENNIGKTLGMTKNAAGVNDVVTVIQEGLITNPGWGLTPNTVYFADVNGLITTTPPATGISVRVGVAITSDTLDIHFSEPIKLN